MMAKASPAWDLAFRIILADLMGGGAQGQAMAPPQPSFYLSDIVQFPSPYQKRWLEPNEEGLVWSYRLPANHTAFITAIGIRRVRKGDYYFYKGSRLVDEPNSTFAYGSIEEPTLFDIGLNTSQEDIEFWGLNGDTQGANFEVLCRGFSIPTDKVDEFFAMLGRSGVRVGVG